MTQNTTTVSSIERSAARARLKTVLLVSLASLFGLSVWFSTNAISSALEVEKSLGEQDVAWLTIAVQLGFVFGTLVIAFTNLADLLNARRLFMLSAISAGLLNLLIIPLDSLPLLIIVRFGTGAALAGVYPPAMKVLSGWYNRNRGFALGMMVGALTVGSGSPHLLRSVFVGNWQAVILGSSFLAFAGGLIMLLLVKDGPYEVPAAKFRPSSMLKLFTERGLRLTLVGYLGHMWELYAFWAWVAVFAAGSFSLAGEAGAAPTPLYQKPYALITAFWHRDTLKTLLDSGKLTVTLMFIIANALILKHVLTDEQIPQAIASSMLSAGLGPVMFLVMVNIILLIGGQFMEPSGLIVIVAPLVFPIAIELGIDPIHLGIIMVVNMEIGLITPPVGLNLFVTSGITGMSILQVVKAAFPWLMILLVFLVLVTYVQILSTFLPDLVFGKAIS